MILRYAVLHLVIIVVLWGCAPQAVPPPAPQPAPTVPPGGTPAPKSSVKPAPAPAPTPPAARPARPRETPSSPSMVASAQWVDEAVQAIGAGDYARATALLERAISVEPNNGKAFYYYGFARGERGEMRAAL